MATSRLELEPIISPQISLVEHPTTNTCPLLIPEVSTISLIQALA
nr:hypothetical protein [Butyrivibrio fibrisolvens]